MMDNLPAGGATVVVLGTGRVVGATIGCLILFDLILYLPSTILQLYREGCSWVEPVLS